MKRRAPATCSQLAAQPRHHLVGGHLAFGIGFQRDIDEAGIGRPSSGKADDAVDRRILLHDRLQLGELGLHRLKGDALIALDRADDEAGVLDRKQAVGHLIAEHVVVEPDRGQERQRHGSGMTKRDAQGRSIEREHRVEHALRRAIEAPVLDPGPARQDQRAHHRRRRQRDDHRDQDRDRQREREFGEQAPDNAAEEEERRKHRDQRQRDRNDGEADLARAADRRLDARHALFEIARDVLEHDDRVVDDEAGRDRQRHQRQVVEAEAEQIHDAERADDRGRHRDARDRRGAHAAQEGEDHQNDEQDRDHQRLLGVVQRLADGLRPVDGDGQVDVARQRGDQAGQFGAHAVDRLDDVRSRLARQDHRDPGLAVDEAGVAKILDRIDNLGDVGEPDRRAVAVSDHQVAILRRMRRLIVGVDLIVVVVVLDRPFRTVGVGGSERGADVLKPDAVVEDRARVDLDPHRRERRAGNVDLADARKLRQPLLQNVGGEVIELSRRMGGRRHGDDHDRRVSRIDLMIGRILAQAGRQIDARGDDRRLDVSRRAVDIAIKAELERDAGRAERALRRHLVDVGDLTQVPFERRRDRRRHRVRARAWHIRLDRDDREVDLRQRRNRELRIAQ